MTDTRDLLFPTRADQIFAFTKQCASNHTVIRTSTAYYCITDFKLIYLLFDTKSMLREQIIALEKNN